MLELWEAASLGRNRIMGEPVVINEKDLLERPPGGVNPKKPGGGLASWLGDIKANAKQIKEIIDTAKSMGLNFKLPGKLGDLLQGSGETAQGQQEGSSPILQAQIFLRLLITKYGDITVNELIEKLRAEVGDKKLSNITGGK